MNTSQPGAGECEHRDPRPPGWGQGQQCGYPASVKVDGHWACEAHGGAW